MDNTYSMIPVFMSVAIKTSIDACRHGAPFGGSLSWLYIVLLTNNSEQYPWSSLQAAFVGYPIVIVCDMALVVPALVISCLKSRRILD